MTRSSVTGDTGSALADPAEVEEPLVRLRPGGTRRPIGLALAIMSLLAALIWQPWGRSPSPIVPSSALRTPGPAVADGAPLASTTPAPSLTPGPTPFSSGGPGPTAYVSLVDNEWTVVALLTPDALAPADAPWGALLVLQQGLSYTVKPLESSGQPDLTCHTPGPSRDRTAVQLPAGRVAYLGVTFPGMNPRARVTAAILDRAGLALRRLPALVVPLSGMTEGFRYTVPSSGSGAAVLFALAPPRILPIATYRFDIETPGLIGQRYLYACIGA